MSTCIHCGECCRTMSPLSVDPEHEPCSRLKMVGTVSICTEYDARPKQCRDHDFSYPVCPIGKDVLKIDDVNQLAAREYEIERALAEYEGRTERQACGYAEFVARVRQLGIFAEEG